MRSAWKIRVAGCLPLFRPSAFSISPASASVVSMGACSRAWTMARAARRAEYSRTLTSSAGSMVRVTRAAPTMPNITMAPTQRYSSVPAEASPRRRHRCRAPRADREERAVMLRGVFARMVTAFDSEGRLHLEGNARIVEHLVARLGGRPAGEHGDRLG